MSSFTLDEMMPLLTRESNEKRGIMLAIFSIISLLLLVVAFFWQTSFESSVTLYVDDSNVINPMLEDVAENASQQDKVSVAKEVLFSKDILDQVLEKGGWVDASMSDVEKERIKEDIINDTEVENINSTLLVFSHRNADPQVAFQTTSLFADLFLEKSMRAQSVESSDAFEFIVDQVETYRGKLEDAERRLESFRSQYPGARPGTEGNVDQRIIELRRQIETTELLYAETSQRRRTLERELSSESSTIQQEYRENQIRDSIADLQAQIDTLRLSYTDDYPDIVRLKQQVQDYIELAQNESARRDAASSQGNSVFNLGGQSYSGSSNLSPVYQQLRADLARSAAEAESLKSRLAQTKVLLNKELGRAGRSTKVERELAELSRDYEINKEIYEELVKRRESARVSLSLGQEKQGVLYRIQEAASFPILPSGLRFMHIALAGLILGAILPFVFLVAFLKLDPRIRTSSAITEELELPLLTVVPHMNLPGEEEPWIRRRSSSIIIILGVLIIYAAVGAIKYMNGVA